MKLHLQTGGEKTGWFQHRTNENTPKFPGIEIVIYNVFIE